MKSTLKNFRQSPRKTRLVANAIRGKKTSNALEILQSLDKKISLPMHKLIKSALANANKSEVDSAKLKIQEIRVNEGVVFKRSRARAMGRSFPIRKRTSTIHITLQ